VKTNRLQAGSQSIAVAAQRLRDRIGASLGAGARGQPDDCPRRHGGAGGKGSPGAGGQVQGATAAPNVGRPLPRPRDRASRRDRRKAVHEVDPGRRLQARPTDQRARPRASVRRLDFGNPRLSQSLQPVRTSAETPGRKLGVQRIHQRIRRGILRGAGNVGIALGAAVRRACGRRPGLGSARANQAGTSRSASRGGQPICRLLRARRAVSSPHQRRIAQTTSSSVSTISYR
jgi:hypothetical protein